MVLQKKLCLVLDLDHTLLNSSRMGEATEGDVALLEGILRREQKMETKSLFPLTHIQTWTKVRPYCRKMLDEAKKYFDMHVYTMGERGYAEEMVKLLDPDGSLFGHHVISRSDSTNNSVKDLDVLIGSERSVLILDDSPRVWHRHASNVLQVERYHFFPSSLAQFNMGGKALLHRQADEFAGNGPLFSILAVLKEIHADYFSHAHPEMVDVRDILRAKKRKVLAGCRFVFSRVFPKEERNPHTHPLWKLSEEFGATCTTVVEAAVTHVIAVSGGTAKVDWAEREGKRVVRPDWVYASSYHFKRVPEERYLVNQDKVTQQELNAVAEEAKALNQATMVATTVEPKEVEDGELANEKVDLLRIAREADEGKVAIQGEGAKTLAEDGAMASMPIDPRLVDAVAGDADEEEEGEVIERNETRATTSSAGRRRDYAEGCGPVSKRKTVLCRYWLAYNSGEHGDRARPCKWGDQCSFAHGVDELQSTNPSSSSYGNRRKDDG